jgi:hypothetical protein
MMQNSSTHKSKYIKTTWQFPFLLLEHGLELKQKHTLVLRRSCDIPAANDWHW